MVLFFMDKNNIVTLLVGGKKYTGWDSVQIDISFNSFARGCQLTATRQSRIASLCEGIENGLLAVVKIGGDTVLTGYIVSKELSYTDKNVNIIISVKSRTVDLEECSIPFEKPHSWKNFNAIDAIKIVSSYYGISVIQNTQSKPIRNIEFSSHGTIKEAFIKILKANSLLVCDDAFGNFVICTSGSNGHATDDLKFGVNVLSGKRNHDVSNVFKHYVVIGQSTDPKSEKTKPGNAVNGYSDNDYFPRERWSVTEQSGNRSQAELQARAELLLTNSIGNADVLTYTVQGWRQSNGDLWKINSLVHVVDPMLNVEQDLLIAKISFRLNNDDGSTTELTLKDKNAFLITDLPEIEKGKKNAVTKKTKKGMTFLAKAGSGRL